MHIRPSARRSANMVTIRTLLFTLLFVPFLSGVNAPAAVSASSAEGATADVISRSTTHITDPALGAAVLASLLDAGSPSCWRTPSRSHAGMAEPLCGADARTAHARAIVLGRTYLRYCRALDHARTNVPITYGNPPPVSLT